MKIKVRCTGQAEEIEMVKVPVFNNSLEVITWKLINYGGRHLPF